VAYKRTNWQDHAVERPRTYTETVNKDGSKTLVPSPGEVYQMGTPLSATNFNNAEEALLHYSVAFDLLMSVVNGLAMDASRPDRIWTTVELPADRWAENIQTVTVPEVTASAHVLVAPDPASAGYQAYLENGVRCVGQGDGCLIFQRDCTMDDMLVVNVEFSK